MLTVPLDKEPSQVVSINLANQSCTISVYTLDTGMFFDLVADGVPIRSAVCMLDGARLLQDAQYLGFIGDFVCVDTLGESDPVYTGLGTQFVLMYLEAADLVTYGG